MAFSKTITRDELLGALGQLSKGARRDRYRVYRSEARVFGERDSKDRHQLIGHIVLNQSFFSVAICRLPSGDVECEKMTWRIENDAFGLHESSAEQIAARTWCPEDHQGFEAVYEAHADRIVTFGRLKVFRLTDDQAEQMFDQPKFEPIDTEPFHEPYDDGLAKGGVVNVPFYAGMSLLKPATMAPGVTTNPGGGKTVTHPNAAAYKKTRKPNYDWDAALEPVAGLTATSVIVDEMSMVAEMKELADQHVTNALTYGGIKPTDYQKIGGTAFTEGMLRDVVKNLGLRASRTRR